MKSTKIKIDGFEKQNSELDSSQSEHYPSLTIIRLSLSLPCGHLAEVKTTSPLLTLQKDNFLLLPLHETIDNHYFSAKAGLTLVLVKHPGFTTIPKDRFSNNHNVVKATQHELQ